MLCKRSSRLHMKMGGLKYACFNTQLARKTKQVPKNVKEGELLRFNLYSPLSSNMIWQIRRTA